MIFRLEYCNKESVTAMVDIQKGDATPVYTVEGTSEPFVLFYNNDKGDKSGSLRSSGADINIYKTAEFNIDELKTSNETEISVKYYINNILNWSGFVIPDFFSETITGVKGVVSMVASDRLGTLKGATLSGLSAKVSNRALAEACLAQTGLSLPLYTMADFTGDGTNIFNSEVLSQRMVDTKGRNVSCYDILSSILEETNSLIVQRNGAWYIVNKLQLEAGSGSIYSAPTTSSAWVENTVSFDEVSVGARRTIKPVAATVGVYHEHGGGQLHPDNYDFSLGVNGWTSVNGFVATTDNREIEYYSNGTPIYGNATSNDYLVNSNERVSGTLTLDTAPYLESASIPVVSTQSDMVDISIDVSITAPGGGYSSATPSFVRYAVIASNGTQTYALNRSGTFEIYDPTNLNHSQTIFIGSDVWGQMIAVSKSQLINGKLEVDLTGFNVKVRIYGSGTYQTTAIYFASVRFSNTAELPKGNIFKTTQGANYTKDHEIPTVLWGDYLTLGLNGYFYDYPIDDTSSLYRPTGELHSKWTAYNDPEQLPLLQHVSRQKSRMFSVAHDLLSAEIKASTFDPLSIFVDCDSTRYVVLSARFDFLRSNVSVELEEVAYATNSKRDYIYSYFGDGEDNIKSIGGISAGVSGGGTGGGLTSEQLEILSWWKKDPDNPNTIFTEMNAYSKLELSAYGLGSVGGGGGSGLIQNVYESSNLGGLFSDSTLTDTFNAYAINSIHERVQTLEAGGGGGGGSTVEWGTLANGYRQLTVEGVTYELAQNTHKHLWADITDKPSTFAPSAHTHAWGDITSKPSTFAPSAHTHLWADITDKPSTFIPSSHTHSAGDTTSGTFAIARIPTGTTGTTVALGNHLHTGVYEPVFSKNTAFNKNFGTDTGTVAQGNDSRINNGQTAYWWGNHAAAGYALNSALSNYLPLTGGTLSGNLTLPNLTADTSVKTPKISIGNNWSIELADTQLQFKYQGVIKHRYFVDGSFSAMGEVAAYSSGTQADELTLNKLVLIAGGGAVDRNITSTDSTIQLNVGGVTALEATSSEVRRGTTASGVTLGTSAYRWSNVYGVEINASTNVTTPKITMGNGWTIEQTSASLTIRKDGVVKGTFNA